MKRSTKIFGGFGLIAFAGLSLFLWKGLTPRGIYYALCGDDVEYEVLTTKGGRVSWSKATGKIAFDSANLPEAIKNGADQTYIMDADGKNITCVSCDLFPKGWTVGNPTWGPEGRWLVVQAASNTCGVNRNLTSPGGGFASDLYAIDTQSRKTKLIRDVPCDESNGVLHSVFSQSGDKLSWSEVSHPVKLLSQNLQFGGWKLMTADVNWSDKGPVLENIQARVPGIEGFYENHGFDKDGKRLIYTAINQSEPGFQQTTISELDLDTNVAKVLATTGFNEHSKYVNDEKSVIFMSDPNRTVMLSFAGYRDNDYHLASRDGKKRCQLTTFNEEGLFPLKDVPGHPSKDYSYAVTDISKGAAPNAVISRLIVNSGHPLPVGNLGAENWIIKITSPYIADIPNISANTARGKR